MRYPHIRADTHQIKLLSYYEKELLFCFILSLTHLKDFYLIDLGL